MPNHYNLNLDFPILKPGFEFPQAKSPYWDIYLPQAGEFVSKEAMSFFDNLGLELKNCHLFRGNPAWACGIHIDGHQSELVTQPIWAINWIMGSNHSEMMWYDPIMPGSEILTNVGTKYQRWTLEEVREIERAEFLGPTLVRTDIPHRVVNYDNKNDRWCISLRSPNRFNDWGTAVEFFRPYFKND